MHARANARTAWHYSARTSNRVASKKFAALHFRELWEGSFCASMRLSGIRNIQDGSAAAHGKQPFKRLPRCPRCRLAL